MKGKTHLFSGIFVFLLFLSFSKLSLDTLIYASFFLLGTLFPDIDVATSTVGKKAKIIGWAFKHRGFFHSLFGLVLISLIPFSFNFFWGIFFAMGYLTHLLEDMLTKSGIRPFIYGFKIRGPLVVGEISEKVICLFFQITSLVLVFMIFSKII